MKKILLTGAAGFIGYHLSLLLLKKGYVVYGVDNLNNNYDKRNMTIKKTFYVILALYTGLVRK